MVEPEQAVPLTLSRQPSVAFRLQVYGTLPWQKLPAEEQPVSLEHPGMQAPFWHVVEPEQAVPLVLSRQPSPPIVHV